MRAVGFYQASPVEEKPLKTLELPDPICGPKEVLVRVSTCGICLTDRHQIEGELPQRYSPTVPGHQIVGKVVKRGEGATRFKEGDRVGVTWLYSACGTCSFCLKGTENLCDQARFTGYDVQGGYAQYIVVSEDYVYPIPERFSDSQAAPLLCAGVIGYRCLRLSGIQPGQTLGLFGFGASAHIVLQVARHWNCRVYAFDRREEPRRLAESLGADWAGTIQDQPPMKLDAAITFAPAEDVVLCALETLQRGGRLIVNAISMEPRREKRFDYQEQFWYEKELKTAANVTRKDAEEFLPLAAQIPIIPVVQEFAWEEANDALIRHKQGELRGAGVLVIAH